MSRVEHVEENLKLAEIEPVSPEQFAQFDGLIIFHLSFDVSHLPFSERD